MPNSSLWKTSWDEPVLAISSSPDSRRWGVLGSEGSAAVLDGAEVGFRRWRAHDDGGFRLCWHPQLNLLATSGGDGKVRLWNPAAVMDGTDFKPLAEIVVGGPWVEHLEWSPDGAFLAAAAGKTLILMRSDGSVVHRLTPGANTIGALCWKSDGTRVAAACYGGVSIVDLQTGQIVEKLPWKTSLVSVAWSPDGRWIVAGTQECSVQIWRLPFVPGEELAMSGYPAKVRDLAWHHQGGLLATGGGEEIMVWDCRGAGPAGRTPSILEGHSARVSALVLQARGNTLVSGSENGEVRFWNIGGTQSWKTLSLVSPITAIGLSRDDRGVLAGSRTGQMVYSLFQD